MKKSNKQSFSSNKRSFSVNKLVDQWVTSADNDLAYAKAGFGETDLWSNVCFSCQQGFEKYLKAYLISKNVDFPKTHDLTSLLKLCALSNSGFAQFGEVASIITPYGTAARYPDIGDLEFSKEQAHEALNAVERLKDFVENKL